MARPNIDNWGLNNRRGSGSIPIGIRNLIICCGEKTEKNYFDTITEDIINQYPKTIGIKFDLEVDAVDPKNMARKLCDRKKELSRYQHVWVVFDKDDFGKDNFDNAINMISGLNSDDMDSTMYHALWSNECIELWFILHFEYLNSDLKRDAYFAKLSNRLGEPYQKNDEHIAGKLLLKGGKANNAIKFANKLLELHKDKTPSNSKPATNIVEFFEHYKDYLFENQ